MISGQEPPAHGTPQGGGRSGDGEGTSSWRLSDWEDRVDKVQPPPQWSRFKWILLVLTVFALHLLSIVYFSQDAKQGKPVPDPQVRIAWKWQQPGGLGDPMELEDATLLALPGPRGFSGATWLNHQPVFLEVPGQIPPTTPLDFSVSEPGAILVRHLESGVHLPKWRAGALPDPAGLDKQPPSLPLRQRTTLELLGDLARRSVRGEIAWKALASRELPQNSQFEIWVDAQGRVRDGRSTDLEPGRSASQRAFDRSALEVIMSLTFMPLAEVEDPDEWSHGRVRVAWGLDQVRLPAEP